MCSLGKKQASSPACKWCGLDRARRKQQVTGEKSVTVRFSCQGKRDVTVHTWLATSFSDADRTVLVFVSLESGYGHKIIVNQHCPDLYICRYSPFLPSAVFLMCLNVISMLLTHLAFSAKKAIKYYTKVTWADLVGWIIFSVLCSRVCEILMISLYKRQKS